MNKKPNRELLRLAEAIHEVDAERTHAIFRECGRKICFVCGRNV